MRSDLRASTAALLNESDVTDARARINRHIRTTPVIHLKGGQLIDQSPEFWLKLESMQRTGSFKARGAINSLSSQQISTVGVCAASGGNHGIAVAWAAQRLGIAASIFLPKNCPEAKVRRLEGYGAQTVIAGDVYEESLLRAHEYQDETGATLIHSYDHPLTAAGAGTLVLEFLDQTGGLDTILVPVGGGGLLAGTVAGLTGSSTRVVAIEPSTSRCLGAALQAGHPVEVDVSGVAIDSLGVRKVGRLGFSAALAEEIQHIEVTDEEILDAQHVLWNELRVGVEPGSAASLAAIISGRYVPEYDERVGIVACGGNFDAQSLMATRSRAA